METILIVAFVLIGFVLLIRWANSPSASDRAAQEAQERKDRERRERLWPDQKSSESRVDTWITTPGNWVCAFLAAGFGWTVSQPVGCAPPLTGEEASIKAIVALFWGGVALGICATIRRVRKK